MLMLSGFHDKITVMLKFLFKSDLHVLFSVN